MRMRNGSSSSGYASPFLVALPAHVAATSAATQQRAAETAEWWGGVVGKKEMTCCHACILVASVTTVVILSFCLIEELIKELINQVRSLGTTSQVPNAEHPKLLRGSMHCPTSNGLTVVVYIACCSASATHCYSYTTHYQLTINNSTLPAY